MLARLPLSCLVLHQNVYPILLELSLKLEQKCILETLESVAEESSDISESSHKRQILNALNSKLYSLQKVFISAGQRLPMVITISSG